MSDDALQIIKNSITTIPDHPLPGILFRDITSLLADAKAFQTTINLLIARYKDQKIDKIVGTEARGFIFGAPLAAAIGAGFVPVRKPCKLPRDTIQEGYSLEYGSDVLQIHCDAIKKDERVLLVDDLLATGGTAEASVKLIQRLGGKVIESVFVIELPALKGAQKIHDLGVPHYSLVSFEGE
ncbi:adenine phosphoribosyltransferase [Psychromonas sp. CNPT3]|uniref:adenine phosphoribosyltransferase n=1 Tax=Psychromonas sp. CNPT3 TaxID=314282 RepID=UPI00006E85C9|nr:adenine phosphoribosyltransferase [Psychromonas sp. CNPT3]AGH81404.1 adenine phosphoribosyltransferase [Psychromonas sp. CNPT3]